MILELKPGWIEVIITKSGEIFIRGLDTLDPKVRRFLLDGLPGLPYKRSHPEQGMYTCYRRMTEDNCLRLLNSILKKNFKPMYFRLAKYTNEAMFVRFEPVAPYLLRPEDKSIPNVVITDLRNVLRNRPSHRVPTPEANSAFTTALNATRAAAKPLVAWGKQQDANKDASAALSLAVREETKQPKRSPIKNRSPTKTTPMVRLFTRLKLKTEKDELEATETRTESDSSDEQSTQDVGACAAFPANAQERYGISPQGTCSTDVESEDTENYNPQFQSTDPTFFVGRRTVDRIELPPERYNLKSEENKKYPSIETNKVMSRKQRKNRGRSSKNKKGSSKWLSDMSTEDPFRTLLESPRKPIEEIDLSLSESEEEYPERELEWQQPSEMRENISESKEREDSVRAKDAHRSTRPKSAKTRSPREESINTGPNAQAIAEANPDRVSEEQNQDSVRPKDPRRRTRNRRGNRRQDGASAFSRAEAIAEANSNFMNILAEEIGRNPGFLSQDVENREETIPHNRRVRFDTDRDEAEATSRTLPTMAEMRRDEADDDDTTKDDQPASVRPKDSKRNTKSKKKKR